MDILLETLTKEWQDLLRMLPRIVVALIVFGASIFIGRLIGRGIVGILSRGNFKKIHRNFFKGLTIWIVVFLGLLTGLHTRLEELSHQSRCGRRHYGHCARICISRNR